MKSFFINIICFVLAVNGAAQQDVSWFDVDGYIIQANNSLLKTADTGENNSGAISANILNAGGSGWMELTVDDVTARYSFGFYPEIGSTLDFSGFRTSPHALIFDAGRVLVMENGAVLSIVQGIKQGDRLKIKADKGYVRYYVNDNTVKTTTITKSSGQLLYAEVFVKNDVMPPLISTFGLQYLIELDMSELDVPLSCNILLNSILKFSVSDTGKYNVGFIPTASDELSLVFTEGSEAEIFLVLNSSHEIDNVEILADGQRDDMNRYMFELYKRNRAIKFIENNSFPDAFDSVNYYELNLEYGMTLLPNGTEFNELRLTGVPPTTNAEIQVFNSKRNMVYTSSDFYNEPWDGRVNFSVIPGNYTYYMNIAGNSVSGQFIIIK